MLSRAYYFNYIKNFLADLDDVILSKLVKNHQFDLEEQQKKAWLEQIRILKENMIIFSFGYVLIEYSIPRMGKRADIILILKDLVFVIEFKVNELQYKSNDINQCFDYALDLKYFHKESQGLKIIPILISTNAPDFVNTYEKYDDDVFKPLRCNSHNLGKTIRDVLTKYAQQDIDPIKWLNSAYKPTPTIIEAAQALYQGHNVKEISRSDSGAENLMKTTETINNVIENSKNNRSYWQMFQPILK